MNIQADYVQPNIQAAGKVRRNLYALISQIGWSISSKVLETIAMPT